MDPGYVRFAPWWRQVSGAQLLYSLHTTELSSAPERARIRMRWGMGAPAAHRGSLRSELRLYEKNVTKLQEKVRPSLGAAVQGAADDAKAAGAAEVEGSLQRFEAQAAREAEVRAKEAAKAVREMTRTDDLDDDEG